ncbi:hypothetical protein EDD17DRAFT_1615217 [Pisolithus thermaeus]|nr:hypothetical protein EDD17DRAFT_1615217 [Pisolithus thermaeus]
MEQAGSTCTRWLLLMLVPPILHLTRLQRHEKRQRCNLVVPYCVRRLVFFATTYVEWYNAATKHHLHTQCPYH